MGYRHYVGYIPKKELPEILKQAEELRSKIGQPNPDYRDEVYSEYDVTRFMRNKAICLFDYIGIHSKLFIILYMKVKQQIFPMRIPNSSL